MENRIKTLAIDDEPLALKQLAAFIKKVPFLELVGECQNAIEARREMEEQTIRICALVRCEAIGCFYDCL